MRRLVWLLAFALVLVVALFSAATLLLRPDSLRAPLQATLSERLGRAVELGRMELVLWPTPRLRVESLRIASDRGGNAAPPLLQSEGIVLRPALLPLLFGQVVIRTLEIDAPKLTLEVDGRGLPVAPRLAPRKAAPGKAEASREPGAAGRETAERSGPSLAIHSIQVRGGSLTAGAWKLENLEASGSLHLDGSAHIEASARLPELGQLQQLALDISGLGRGSPKLALSGKFAELDPGELARRLGEVLRLQAKAKGIFDLVIDQGTVKSAGTDLELEVEDFRSGELELMGPIPIQARLGDSFSVDLTRAALRIGQSFQKHAGDKLRLSGPLSAALPPKRLEDLTLELASSKVPLAIQLDPVVVEIGAADVALPPLRRWLPATLSDLDGSLKIEALRVTPEPLGVAGHAVLEGVSIELERGRARVSGPVQGLGQRLQAGPLELELADQRLSADVGYRLDTGNLDVTLGTAQTDLARWVAALLGRDDAEGTLDLHAQLQDVASAPMRGLRGHGSIQIDQGRIRGFSIARKALGVFATLPLLASQLGSRDLSRYLDEHFDRLSATWTIRDGSVTTRDLVIVQRDARLELAGSVGLWDGALELRGRLIIGPEIDAALAGANRGRQKVIPIAGIAGTITRPRVHLDRAAVAEVASSYLATSRLQKKLEERLGPGGAEAVQGILDQLLGGKRKSR